MKQIILHLLIPLYAISIVTTIHGQGMQSTESIDDVSVSYERIQPILKKHCVACHNDEETRGNLSLASLEKIAAGSNSGPVVVPGNVEESPIYLVTAHLDNPKMPPNKPRIPQRELELLERWIRTGSVKEFAVDSESAPAESKHIESVESSATSVVAMEPMRWLPHKTPFSASTVARDQRKLWLTGLEQLISYEPQSGRFQERAIAIRGKQITTMQWGQQEDVLWLAAGTPGEYGEVICLDTNSGQVVKEIGKDGDTIPCFDVSPDGKYIAMGTRSRKVQIYSTIDGSLRYVWNKHTDWVTAISFSPDSLLLASADRFGTIHLWDTSSGEEFITLRGHAGTVTALAWSNEGEVLYSTGWDGTVRTWDLHQGTQSNQGIAIAEGVLGMKPASGKEFVHREDLLVVFGRKGLLTFWDPQANQSVSNLKLEEDIIQLDVVAVPTSRSEGIACRIFASDALGNGYEIDGLREVNPRVRDWRLPVREEPSIIPIRRSSTLVRVSEDSNGRRPPFESRSEPKSKDDTSMAPSKAGNGANDPGSELPSWRLALLADIEESERALGRIQSSKKSAIETLALIEESEAQTQQMIRSKKTRLKQLERNEQPLRKSSK